MATGPHIATYSAIVGQVLAKERNSAQVSQASLAAHLGVAQSVVSRIESGNLPLSVDLLARISRFLRVRPDAVIAQAELAAKALKQRRVRVLYQRGAPEGDSGPLLAATAVGALIALALSSRR